MSKDNEIVPLAIGERLHANLPNSKMVVLSDVGHAAQEEKPSLLLPYLQQFLDTKAHRPAPGSE